jgi:hypothetical protein
VNVRSYAILADKFRKEVLSNFIEVQIEIIFGGRMNIEKLSVEDLIKIDFLTSAFDAIDGRE